MYALLATSAIYWRSTVVQNSLFLLSGDAIESVRKQFQVYLTLLISTVDWPSDKTGEGEGVGNKSCRDRDRTARKASLERRSCRF